MKILANADYVKRVLTMWRNTRTAGFGYRVDVLMDMFDRVSEGIPVEEMDRDDIGGLLLNTLLPMEVRYIEDCLFKIVRSYCTSNGGQSSSSKAAGNRRNAEALAIVRESDLYNKLLASARTRLEALIGD